MTPTGSSTPLSEVSPAVVSPTQEVSGLPSTGNGLPGDESPWSLWLLAGLMLAAAGAVMSLGLQLFAFPRFADGPPPPPPAPTDGRLRRLLGRSSRSSPVVVDEAPVSAEPQSGAETTTRSVALTVAGVDDFDTYLDLLRALSRAGDVSRAHATGLSQAEGSFELELAASTNVHELAGTLSERLGRSVAVVQHDDGDLRLQLDG
jgi:hypothetical protein